jgi:hypothetical protein
VFADLVDGANVRMIECGGGTRFEEEMFLCALLADQVRRQKLQGDHSTQALVTGFVDPPHRAGAERRQYEVLSHSTVGPFDCVDARAPASRGFELGRQCIDEAAAFVTLDELFDLATQGCVIPTLPCQQTRAARRRALDRRTEYLLDALPALVAHAPSSLFSQARASVQSRFTVAGEISSASAVSSTLMPP